MLLPPQRRPHAGGAEPRPLRRQGACVGRCRQDLARGRLPGVSAAARRRRRACRGPWCRSGRSKARAARSGPARCRAACSARTTAAIRGSWSTRCGSAPSAPSGSAAATTCRASTRSARTRCAPANCWSASAAAAPGTAPTTARPGRTRAAGMRADYMPPERAEDPNVQDPHRIVRCAAQPGGAVVPASQRHLALGRRCRVTGSGSPRCRCPASALPSPPIPRTRTPPGSSRPKPTRGGCR